MTWQFEKKYSKEILFSIWVNTKIYYIECHFYNRKLIGLILELFVRTNSLLVIDIYDFSHLVGLIHRYLYF
jgi:hypothetical protein